MQSPSKEKLISLIKFFKNNQFSKLEMHAKHLIQTYPRHKSGWNALGALCIKKNEKVEALNIYLKAVNIIPEDAETYNNLGLVQQQLGHLKKSEKNLKKALKLDNKLVNAKYNLANTLYFLGKKKEAEICYLETLKMLPNHFLANMNLGITLLELRRLEESRLYFSKALELNPNDPKAYNCLGNTFFELGNLEKAVNCFTNAININFTYSEAWNNLYYSLHIANNLKSFDYNNLAISFQKQNNYQSNEELHILNLKLNIGKKNAKKLSKVSQDFLSKNKNIKIFNPEKPSNDQNINNDSKISIINLLHFGRSGTGLLHSLIDNHPEISTLPSIYLSEFFDTKIWEDITNLGWSNTVDRFIKIYSALLDTRSSQPVPSINKSLIKNLGINEGLTELGKNKNEYLNVNQILFKKELNKLISKLEYLDQLTFFKLIHIAYEKIFHKRFKKNKIFYHIHNPDINAKLNFLRQSPNSKWIVMVRDPVESLESWIYNYFFENNYSDIVVSIKTMLYEIDNFQIDKDKCIGVRLEDLKTSPYRTIPALCKWMEIKEEKTLYKMTVQGKKWWGDKSSSNKYAFGKMNKSKKGKVFSKKDYFILETLFYPFREKFSYVKKDRKKFKNDLKVAYPLIREIFDFEKELANKMNVSFKEFMKYGYCRYLRTIMLERWSTLNKYHDYPNILEPLKIDS